MWDAELKIGKIYSVFIEMISGELNINKYYSIFKEDGKLHIIENCQERRKGIFKINKVVKYKINWRKPFARREISEVLIECLDNKEKI